MCILQGNQSRKEEKQNDLTSTAGCVRPFSNCVNFGVLATQSVPIWVAVMEQEGMSSGHKVLLICLQSI